MKTIAPIKKTESMLQIAYGEVYAPDFPDAHGDYMTRDEIRKMAHNFLGKGLVNQIDHEHDNNLTGSVVVESYIARDDDPVFIPGSWVLGVHVRDEKYWDMIQSGEINGFSFQGRGKGEAQELEISIPEEIRGKTEDVDGHSHDFVVYYDEEGTFLGGNTLPATDSEGRKHTHMIKRGTLTEEAEHGSHRFSYVELIVEDGSDGA